MITVRYLLATAFCVAYLHGTPDNNNFQLPFLTSSVNKISLDVSGGLSGQQNGLLSATHSVQRVIDALGSRTEHTIKSESTTVHHIPRRLLAAALKKSKLATVTS